MQLELTSPAKGKRPGEKVTVSDGEGRWMIANGYAKVEDDGDHRLDTSVEAVNDPTLAANREAPGEPVGSIANDEDAPDHSTEHVERYEFKGESSPENKIIPGRKAQETGVEALEEAVDDTKLANEGFDPAEHSVDEVNDYLATASDEEKARVLAAEKDGKNRSTVKA